MGLSRALGNASDFGRQRIAYNREDEEIKRREAEKLAERQHRANQEEEAARRFEIQNEQGLRAFDLEKEQFANTKHLQEQATQRQRAMDMLSTLRGGGVSYLGDPMDLPGKLKPQQIFQHDEGGYSETNPMEELIKRAPGVRAKLPNTDEESYGDLGDGFVAIRKPFNPNTGMGSMFSAAASQANDMTDFIQYAMNQVKEAGENAHKEYLSQKTGLEKQFGVGSGAAGAPSPAMFEIMAQRRKAKVMQDAMQVWEDIGKRRFGSRWSGIQPSPRQAITINPSPASAPKPNNDPFAGIP